MISSLAQEIAKWIAEHHGARPSAIRVPQAVVDACIEDGKSLGLLIDDSFVGEGMQIADIPVLVDPTLTIGKIDP